MVKDVRSGTYDVVVHSPDGEDRCEINFEVGYRVEDGEIVSQRVKGYKVKFRPDWLTESIINEIKTEINEQ